jgi:hypothetical protein
VAAKSLAKVRINQYRTDSQYATEEYILESLHALKAKYDLPIFQLLATLGKSTDSVSLSKDKPYFSFYARKSKDVLRIIIRHQGEDIQLQAPLSVLNVFQRQA